MVTTRIAAGLPGNSFHTSKVSGSSRETTGRPPTRNYPRVITKPRSYSTDDRSDVCGSASQACITYPNALAVTALATHAGVAWPDIRAGLAEFRGARRRLQVQGCVDDITVADDYAHHPTEIRATLKAARQRLKPRRLWCVFQPHQHSRTRFLLKDFAKSFEHADEVIVPKIFFVRDSERERQTVSAADLVDQILATGRHAVHIAEFETIVQNLVNQLEPGDLVLTMGAGDIWKVADVLVQRLREHRSC